jgi:hypothetical protein
MSMSSIPESVSTAKYANGSRKNGRKATFYLVSTKHSGSLSMWLVGLPVSPLVFEVQENPLTSPFTLIVPEEMSDVLTVVTWYLSPNGDIDPPRTYDRTSSSM